VTRGAYLPACCIDRDLASYDHRVTANGWRFVSLRIGYVTQWYDPEIGAAAVSGSIARALHDRGHSVQVLTGFPNYPGGRIYPGYQLRPYQREVMNGVTVHRAPLYVSHDSNPLRRSSNYLSFAAAATAVGLSTLKEIDVALVYSGPITAAIPAMALRATRGIPFVLLVADMWPQSVTASGFLKESSESSGGRTEQALHRLCDAVYSRASRIAVTSPGMKDLISERGVPEHKIALVPHWADESHFYPKPTSVELVGERAPRPAFTVMYAGSLGDVQGLDIVVEAANLLRARTDIAFVFVGGGIAEPALRARVSELGLSNVRFLGQQPLERMSEILTLGDVQLITLRDLPVFRATMPSKVQSILASGRPIIGAVAGDAAAALEASGAATLISPGSSIDLAAAVEKFERMERAERERMGVAGRKYYDREFGRPVGGARLENLLQRAASDGRQ